VLPFQTYSVLVSVHDTQHHLAESYRESVLRAARLAEDHGYTGALLHTNLHQVDPWYLVPTLLERTSRLIPLVATNPTAMPPHTLARLIAAAHAVHHRRIAINLVTGADPAELLAVGDDADHDGRYRRARSYIGAMRELLCGGQVTLDSPLWNYREFVLDPSVPPSHQPEVFVAGSSPAGLATAAEVAQVAVTHATDPAGVEMRRFVDTVRTAGLECAIRVGILAGATSELAWRVAERRFPAQRAAMMMTAQKSRSESRWMRDLATAALSAGEERTTVWYGAFAAGKSHAAYLVGSYDDVAEVLDGYRQLGVRRLLVDGPYNEEEFGHHAEVFARIPDSDAATVRP
jgi:alkanesulfonate monooxygenase